MHNWLREHIPFISTPTKSTLPLREFIYLDEVSVVSLLASLTREVTESRMDSETSEQQKRSRYRLRAFTSKIPGVGASRERLKIDRETEEVVRRSEIQSKFDELYTETADSLELVKWADTDDGVRLPISEVDRGGIMELRVEFAAHELYHFYKAYQYLFDIFEEHGGSLNQDEEQIIELMGSLFGDQIPVVGEAVNYCVVDNEIRSVDEIDETDDEDRLLIVGTIEPDMLWQDSGQFLYDENTFTAYCRVPDPAFQDEWDPVKLTRVIKSISTEIGDRLSHIIEAGFTQAKNELDTPTADGDPDSSRLHGLVDDYCDHIEDQEPIRIGDEQRDDLLQEGIAENVATTDGATIEFETDVLKTVTDVLEDQHDGEFDREALAEYRHDLLQASEDPDTQSASSTDKTYLEVSFVAIYW